MSMYSITVYDHSGVLIQLSYNLSQTYFVLNTLRQLSTLPGSVRYTINDIIAWLPFLNTLQFNYYDNGSIPTDDQVYVQAEYQSSSVEVSELALKVRYPISYLPKSILLHALQLVDQEKGS